MYFSHMERLKFINIHIGINYEGYSFKNVSSKWVTCGMVCKRFCNSTLHIWLDTSPSWICTCGKFEKKEMISAIENDTRHKSGK